jgi:1,4-alpha-glucan branching enzyme
MREIITETIEGGETMGKKKKGYVEKKFSTTQTFEQPKAPVAGINKEYLPTQKMCRVTFKLPQTAAPDAKSVNIVGDFNNWNMSTHPLQKDRDGDFTIKLELSPGKDYQFRYLIDGSRWENDWHADRYVRSPFGDSDNSVVST